MYTPMARATRLVTRGRVILLAMALGLLFSLVLAGCAATQGGPAIASGQASTPSTAFGHSTSAASSSSGTGSSAHGSSTAAISPTATISSSTTGQSTATLTATPGGPHAIVEVIGSIASGFQFYPASLTVKMGTTVRWINTTGMPHSSTSDVGSTVRWDSLTISPEGTFSFTFAYAGTYHYHCAFHPTMQGTIVVTS